jgi:hypothetical protein
MAPEIDELTELAYEGGAPLSTTPIVGAAPGSPTGPPMSPPPPPPAWWADALLDD